jgi:nitrite reductase/ring-hydroxylating ferredoxin subunit
MASDPGCTSCPLDRERREFLRAAGAALAALGLLGIVPGRAQAAPIRRVAALPPQPLDACDEKRYPTPAADGASIDRDNGVIVARTGGRVYAFSLACPHQNTALRWNAADRQYQCPKHKSRYGEDGTFIEGRATRSMDRLPIRRDGATILVDVDTVYQQDERPKEWEAAFVAV